MEYKLPDGQVLRGLQILSLFSEGELIVIRTWAKMLDERCSPLADGSPVPGVALDELRGEIVQSWNCSSKSVVSILNDLERAGFLESQAESINGDAKRTYRVYPTTYGTIFFQKFPEVLG